MTDTWPLRPPPPRRAPTLSFATRKVENKPLELGRLCMRRGGHRAEPGRPPVAKTAWARTRAGRGSLHLHAAPLAVHTARPGAAQQFWPMTTNAWLPCATHDRTGPKARNLNIFGLNCLWEVSDAAADRKQENLMVGSFILRFET